MKKRILVLLSVVALMVVMLAMSIAPAFAKDAKTYSCVNPAVPQVAQIVPSKEQAQQLEAQGWECQRSPHSLEL
jgi:hypothetical protein